MFSTSSSNQALKIKEFLSSNAIKSAINSLSRNECKDPYQIETSAAMATTAKTIESQMNNYRLT